MVLAGVARAESREEQQRGVAADLVVLADGPGLVSSAVDFSEGNLRSIVVLFGEVMPSW